MTINIDKIKTLHLQIKTHYNFFTNKNATFFPSYFVKTLTLIFDSYLLYKIICKESLIILKV